MFDRSATTGSCRGRGSSMSCIQSELNILGVGARYLGVGLPIDRTDRIEKMPVDGTDPFTSNDIPISPANFTCAFFIRVAVVELDVFGSRYFILCLLKKGDPDPSPETERLPRHFIGNVFRQGERPLLTRVGPNPATVPKKKMCNQHRDRNARDVQSHQNPQVQTHHSNQADFLPKLTRQSGANSTPIRASPTSNL